MTKKELEQELLDLKSRAIIPKFKIGQEIYFVSEMDDGLKVYNSYDKGSVETICLDNKTIWYNCRYEDGLTYSHSQDNENIFATQSEAEEALRKMKGE